MEEGLRDRKKRELRQLISDTATAMFLDHGFDQVRVSDVAEACGVSEKTVFNYFPTKESLLLDREPDQTAAITDALRDKGDGASLTQSVVAMIEQELEEFHSAWADEDSIGETMGRFTRFHDLIQETPALRAAADSMRDRLSQVVAEALGDRAGVDPNDPEPQLAALIILGLWRTQFVSMRRHAEDGGTLDELRAAVVEDVRRAARVADSGLSSFNLMLHKGTGRDQLREAAEAANDARRQVVTAMKQARDAWRKLAAEHKALHHAEHVRQEARKQQQTVEREVQQQLRERERQIRQEIREHQREIRQRQAELRRQQAEVRRQMGRQQRQRPED